MLTKEQKEEIEKIAKKYSLRLILLFGSQVKGKTNLDSDFDVAYLPEKPLGIEKAMDLNSDLMDIFGSDKIDQVNIKKANPLLLYEISRNSQMLSGKEIDYERFKARAFRIFTDNVSLFKLQDALIKKRHQFLAKRIYD